MPYYGLLDRPEYGSSDDRILERRTGTISIVVFRRGTTNAVQSDIFGYRIEAEVCTENDGIRSASNAIRETFVITAQQRPATLRRVRSPVRNEVPECDAVEDGLNLERIVEIFDPVVNAVHTLEEPLESGVSRRNAADGVGYWNFADRVAVPKLPASLETEYRMRVVGIGLGGDQFDRRPIPTVLDVLVGVVGQSPRRREFVPRDGVLIG